MTPRLLLAFPGSLIPRGADYSLDAKSLDGIRSLTELWPGRVVLCADVVDIPPPPGERWFTPDDLGIDVVTGSDLEAAVARAGDGLILAPLITATTWLGRYLSRTVLVCEFSPDDLTRHEVATSSGLFARARVSAGGHLRARAQASMVRAARGIQANGYPAYDAWSGLARSAHLFFDSRISSRDVDAAIATGRTAPHSTPRLAFSGRLIAAKGPAFAIEIARRLQTQMVVYGTGEDVDSLRALAPPWVTFSGHADFESQWLPSVRRDVDLLVLPHVQGDPSGTYLEAAGCGVPVIGFANVALEALTRLHGIGWTAPMRDVDALTSQVAAILADPAAWRAARTACLDFMTGHDFATETRSRVEHLLSLV